MQLDSTYIANAAFKHTTQTVLYTCLHYGLRLLHPFMPCVTEELYHRLALLCGQPRTTIMNAPFPEPAPLAALLRLRAIRHACVRLLMSARRCTPSHARAAVGWVHSATAAFCSIC